MSSPSVLHDIPLSRGCQQKHVIYVFAPAYGGLSGGIRVMNLLVHHLNRLGLDAYTTLDPGDRKAPFAVPYLDHATRKQHLQARRIPIVVYPEAVEGNPYQAPFVVRYLLNKPGYLVPGAERGFSDTDYFISYAPEHVPTGRHAFDLFIPLVDDTIYFPPPSPQLRHGFVLFSNHIEPDIAMLPNWIGRRTVVSMKAPLGHAALGGLYRRSRAMVTWERTAAIYEALSCGCPVICMPGGPFNEATYQRRFHGKGLVWGWQPNLIPRATREAATFRAIHADIQRAVPTRIAAIFDEIMIDVDRRLGGDTAAVPLFGLGDD